MIKVIVITIDIDNLNELTANSILLCLSFSSSAALASSLLTLAMFSLVRTCHLLTFIISFQKN